MDGPGPPWCSQLTIQHDGPFCATFPFIRDLFCLKNNSYIQWLVQISKFTFTFCSLGSRTRTHAWRAKESNCRVHPNHRNWQQSFLSVPIPFNLLDTASANSNEFVNRVRAESWPSIILTAQASPVRDPKQFKKFQLFFVNIFYWPTAIVSTECKARAIITILVVVVVDGSIEPKHFSHFSGPSPLQAPLDCVWVWLNSGCAQNECCCACSLTGWLVGWLDTKCSISCNGHPMVPRTLDHCVDAIIHWAQSGCSLACVCECAIEKYQDIFHAGKVTASRTRCTTTTFPTFSCSNWILVQSSTARSRRGPSHWMSVIIAHCNNEI